MTDRLTAKAALKIMRNKSRLKNMTGPEYKMYIRAIMEQYGLEKNEAYQLARGKKVLEIVAKYETGNDIVSTGYRRNINEI